jgi:hypothetical protein
MRTASDSEVAADPDAAAQNRAAGTYTGSGDAAAEEAVLFAKRLSAAPEPVD